MSTKEWGEESMYTWAGSWDNPIWGAEIQVGVRRTCVREQRQQRLVTNKKVEQIIKDTDDGSHLTARKRS